MEDKWYREPHNVHKDTCQFYVNRSPIADTTEWHLADTIEEADNIARNKAKSNGAKHCGVCLDGISLT